MEVEVTIKNGIKNIEEFLKILGYSDLFSNVIVEARQDSSISPNYANMISAISKELSEISKLDDFINPMENSGDASHFLIEVSSFLREIECPYDALTEGPLNSRLSTPEQRLLLAEFLLSELAAARLIDLNKPTESNQLAVSESHVSVGMNTIISVLGLDPSCKNLAIDELMKTIIAKLNQVLLHTPMEILSRPLFKENLQDDQWIILEEKLYKQMDHEYELRRKVLLKRLDVTVESFKWSNRTKALGSTIDQIYEEMRPKLLSTPKVILADFLAAREDLTVIQKVPDRGGRVEELEPPPPEMPAWKKRIPGEQDRSSRGGGGRGRGGKANWGHNESQQRSQAWSEAQRMHGWGHGETPNSRSGIVWDQRTYRDQRY